MAAASVPRWSAQVSPTPMEVSLQRVANAVEKLSESMAAPMIVTPAEFLANIDPGELDEAVLERKSLSIPLMETVLDVLREWASGA